MPTPADSPDRSLLRDLIDQHFDKDDLRNLCFDLNVDYDNLRGEGKLSNIRELIAYMERRGRLTELVEQCRKLRPRVEWPHCEDDAKIRADYLEYLVKEFGEHAIRGFSPLVSGRVLSLPLSKVFLPLQAIEGRPALAEYAQEDLRRQAAAEVAGELDWHRRREELEKRYAQLSARQAAQRSLALADLLKSARAVLLGDPGAGKTTVTRYIAYALAAGDTEHSGESVRGRIPVLVRVANYARAYERDQTLHLIEYVERELMQQPEFGRYLRRAIGAGECLVILDGLDEVTNPSLRIQVTQRIQEMVAGFAANHFMVTSRIVGYDISPLTREFKHATLKELTPADQRRFVELWYGAIKAEIGEGAPAQGAASLIEALRNKPQIARMAANPLLLTIMVLMHWRGTKLPGRRVQVYQNATDTLIEYWTLQRAVELDAEDVKPILASIAHHILSSNVGGVIGHHDLLPRFYSGIAEQRGCDAATARREGQKLLKDLNEQSGLFLERGRDADDQPVYGFLHQTFGEYLAALHLAQLIFANTFELEDYVHRGMWHEPLLLLVGHLAIVSPTHAEALIRAILDFPALYDDVLHRNTLLAADCLADDVQVRPRLRDEALDRLARLLHGTAPQVQAAALERYQGLAVTRHREHAVAALRRAYPLDDLDALASLPIQSRLNLATALLHLEDEDTARPILWPLHEAEIDPDIRSKVQRLLAGA